MDPKWLWAVGPVGLLAVFFIVYRLGGKGDGLRARTAEIWRASWGPSSGPGAPSAALPADFAVMLDNVGGGEPIGVYELVRKEAWLGIFRPALLGGTDHITVFMRLYEPGPTVSVAPLPFNDEGRVPNVGVRFTKDPEFTARFQVEGASDRAIKQWLSPPVREELLELEDAFLEVDGKRAAISLYTRLDEDALDALVGAADVIFAEYGASEASLFGNDLPSYRAPAPKPKSGKPAATTKAPADKQPKPRA